MPTIFRSIVRALSMVILLALEPGETGSDRQCAREVTAAELVVRLVPHFPLGHVRIVLQVRVERVARAGPAGPEADAEPVPPLSGGTVRPRLRVDLPL